MGFLTKAQISARKREREKCRKQIMQSQDSAIGTSEDESNNELGAPRDITPAENRSQIDNMINIFRYLLSTWKRSY